MRYSSIKPHLEPYIILARRRTTINHAFASAIAPSDSYDDVRVRAGMEELGQNPDADLHCSYCEGPAETWDHVFATVKDSHFSGHGHRIGNLLPCCKPCNSAKGNKGWRQYISSLKIASGEIDRRSKLIENFLGRFGVKDPQPVQSEQYAELQKVRKEVLALLAKADEIAASIRSQSSQMAKEPEGQENQPLAS
ncbi:MAG TPA: HNH endonuclease [Chthoniobacterales bacterium]